MSWTADPLERRRVEREQRLGLAREHVEHIGRRIAVTGAVVAGSIARGDFNLWSDIDVVVVSDGCRHPGPLGSKRLAAKRRPDWSCTATRAPSSPAPSNAAIAWRSKRPSAVSFCSEHCLQASHRPEPNGTGSFASHRRRPNPTNRPTARTVPDRFVSSLLRRALSPRP
jgi:hypothetical protein